MRELEKYLSIIKNDANKCYIWLTIFVGRCYIPQQAYNFYARVDRDQPFVNLKDDITFFKAKGGVVVFVT